MNKCINCGAYYYNGQCAFCGTIYDYNLINHYKGEVLIKPQAVIDLCFGVAKSDNPQLEAEKIQRALNAIIEDR